MNCLAAGHTRPCQCEATHTAEQSPGPIDDEETLCRGGYTMHNHKGNPKLSLIRIKDLKEGGLSVWRLAPLRNTLSDVHKQLTDRKKQGEELIWIFGVKAGHLRALLPTAPLCAIDDTDCGGDRHPDHGVLAPCTVLNFKDIEKPEEDPACMSMRRALHEIFAKQKVWEATVVS